MFTQTEQEFALKLAKSSILSKFYPNNFTLPDQENILQHFLEPKASFITLKTNNQDLRGCIGHITAREELYLSIWNNAQSAAFGDPRFLPLTLSEIESDPDFVLEISVLTEPKIIDFQNITELTNYLEEKKTGLIIQQGGLSATFLPDVWQELPDVDDFLNHLVRKAGGNINEFWSNPGNRIFSIYFTQQWQNKWKNIN